MSILVCGGAGYVGSHMVKYLVEKNVDVIVVDNLSTGYKESIDEKAKCYFIDIKEEEKLDKVFKENKIDCVIHFAANSLVGESMKEPLKYYDNNLFSTKVLLDVMKNNNCKKIVFSSTAAVYGDVKQMPITENTITIPTNAYGDTKLAMENMIKWCDHAHGIKYIALRYFNVAGAHNSGLIGEAHNPETHLIPIILEVANKKRNQINIFGDDYDTTDGTCIRDYIHIEDLVRAHYLAYEKLMNNASSDYYNLGSGEGFSVKEMINAAKKVTNLEIKSVISPRREGDPAKLIASNQKALNELKWEPKYKNIEDIIKSAWNFHKEFPNGYRK